MTEGWPYTRPANAMRSLGFFGLLYLYLWLAVEPCLIYGCATITNFPVFYRGWPFLWECLSYPGGLLRYLCAVLPQFFYFSWAGALVITGQAWAFFACTGWFLRGLGVPGWRLLRFVPTLLVLAVYARYRYHFSTITGALASLLFACLYVALVARTRREPVGCAVHTHGSRASCPRSEGGTPSTRAVHTSSPSRMRAWCAQHTLRIDVAAYLVLSAISYIVSAAAYLPFAVLCVIYELLYRRRYAVGLVYGLAAVILPYIMGVLVFRVSSLSAYTDLLPFSWQIRGWATREKMISVVYALYLFPIVVALAWGLWRVVGRRSSSPKGKARGGVAKQRLAWLRGPAVQWTMGSVLLFAGAGAVAAFTLDRSQKALLAVHYYALQRRWPEVLQAAHRCPESYPVMNAVNRALYHTGRLNRDMFYYTQDPAALMLTGEDHSVLYWHKFDTLIDLGLVNLAEKNLVECMESFGAHPLILQRLALVNLVKGKIETARIYLGALHKTLFFRTWARDYLAHLDADPTLAGDPQIRPLRARSLQKDSTVFFFAQEPMLRSLVEQGGGNRMALEYLMAWYLLTRQSEKVVQNLSRLPEFGYTDIPPLYQEAAVIYAYGTKKPLPLGGLGEAQRRIEHFSSVFNRHGRDKAAAFPELARDYAGSYFFYFIYASVER